MKKSILIFSLLLASIAQAQTIQELQYGAYLKASKSLWERAIKSAQAQYGEDSFETAQAMYGLLNSTMANRDEDTFDEYVDTASDILKKIIVDKPSWGEPKAVLSSIYGLRIAYASWKGMLYGSKSGSLMSEAYAEQPESPLVQKLYGGYKLYTPEMWGGDVTKAAASFEKAIAIYERDGNTDNWFFLDAMVSLSLAYKKQGKTVESKKMLEKALKYESEFGWAKSLLSQIK